MIMRKLAVFLLAISAASCLSLNDPDVDRTELPANLEFYAYDENVAAPTTAPRGTAFNVTFTTYGGGCTERTDNEVVVSGLDVHIYSTQVVRVGQPCPDVLKTEAQTVAVTVILSGTATIHVHGWRQPENEEIVVVRSVTITP